YAVTMSCLLGLQLLAGHYHLAFITLLGAGALLIWRLFLSEPRQPPEQSPDWSQRSPQRAALLTVLFLMAGGLLAAVQLSPTWELKQRSQRQQVGAEHDPGYGHLPPLYLSQLIAPWFWYAPDIDLDQALVSLQLGSYPASTNKVEAHL